MQPVLLIILDGFGHRREPEGNAIAAAKIPFFTSLLRHHPHALLDAAGEAVGLPKGTMGNSEVGHLTIGAGRVIFQDYTRINRAIKDKSFFANLVIVKLAGKVKARNATLHLMGLLSDGCVHAHIDHILSLITIAKKEKVRTAVHLFTDGRDMDPHSSLRLVARIEEAIKGSVHISIATVEGRYYAMDRDKRWNRIRKAYKAIVHGEGERAASAREAVEKAYARKESDEFILPTVIGNYAGFGQRDAVFFFNFRADRARQLCSAFAQEGFRHFATAGLQVELATMTQYDKELPVDVAFPPERPDNCMAEAISRAGLRQLHVAETEKYPHVTYFFNGGQEEQFPLEERILVPSRKVSTYDLVPGMSAEKITGKVVGSLGKGYQFILVNFANPDMVGHTGKFEETVRALKIIDRCLKRIVQAAQDKFVVAITADHGNCEEMRGETTTSHTTNKVPIVILSGKKLRLHPGGLEDVAPTLLQLMGLKVPKGMTGKILTETFK